jgi:hypothetical protein
MKQAFHHICQRHSCLSCAIGGGRPARPDMRSNRGTLLACSWTIARATSCARYSCSLSFAQIYWSAATRVLALQVLQPLPLVRREPGALAPIPLPLADPLAQRLGRAAELACDRANRRPVEWVLGTIFVHEATGPLADLREYRLGRAWAYPLKESALADRRYDSTRTGPASSQSSILGRGRDGVRTLQRHGMSLRGARQAADEP